MKYIKLVAIIMLAASNLVLAKEGDVHEEIVAINDISIPAQFHSESEVYIFVFGWLPSSCYELKEIKIEHLSATLHQVSARALVVEAICLAIIIPFQREIHLGKMVAGEHILRFLNNNGTSWEEKLRIEE